MSVYVQQTDIHLGENTQIVLHTSLHSHSLFLSISSYVCSGLKANTFYRQYMVIFLVFGSVVNLQSVGIS